MDYEAMDGRPIDPTNPVDRQIIAGLPARDRRLRHGKMLFGAFIAFTSASSASLRSADRIDLRIDGGRLYRSLSLPAGNPYAYSSRVIRPRRRIPVARSPANVNMATTGQLLLVRVPKHLYTSGAIFELVIQGPSEPDHTASLII